MPLATYIIPVDMVLNLFIILLSFLSVFYFARKAASSYRKVREQVLEENEFYTEIILGLESVGQNVCDPRLLDRKTRIAVWELYNNIRVQPNKENKSIVLQRKMLEKKQQLYKHLEEGRVNLEVLPFVGIIGTLLGFAVPYMLKLGENKFSFNVTGFGFFLAASSTIIALLALILLKKKYEASTMADFDYYVQQQNTMEKIMIAYDGFKLLEEWLKKWPELPTDENALKVTSRINAEAVQQFID